MKKKLEDAKGFRVNELSKILWASRTTYNSATKDMLFTLAFRHEAVILAEIGVDTLRVSKYNVDDNDEKLIANLTLIDEDKRWSSSQSNDEMPASG